MTKEMLKRKQQVWVMFDNTASRAAVPNALQLKELIIRGTGKQEEDAGAQVRRR